MGLLKKMRNALGAGKADTSVTSASSVPPAGEDAGTPAKEDAGTAGSPDAAGPSGAPDASDADGSRDAGDAGALAVKAAEGVMRPGMTPHVAAVADLAFGAVNPF